MQIHRVLPFIVPAALALGCHSEEPAQAPQAPMQLASRSVNDLADAALELATARCLSAQRCAEIETDSRFSDLSQCRPVMKSEAAREIDFCPKGVSNAGIRACSEAWTQGECQGAFAPLTALPECRTERICAQ